MHALGSTIQASFGYYFGDFLARVQALASDLSDAEFWHNPYPYGNSIGHLVLHVTGNLNYYIGSQLAATGYLRNRAAEFAQPPIAKAEALDQLARAVDIVLATLAAQHEDDWATPYRADGADDVPDRLSIFLRCAVHFHHHIGQMGYTKEELLQPAAEIG